MACNGCGGLPDIKVFRTRTIKSNSKSIKVNRNSLQRINSKTCPKCNQIMLYEFDGKSKKTLLRCPICNQKYLF